MSGTGQWHRAWETSADIQLCFPPAMAEQKLRHIHNHPLQPKWRLVSVPEDHPHSSAGHYKLNTPAPVQWKEFHLRGGPTPEVKRRLGLCDPPPWRIPWSNPMTMRCTHSLLPLALLLTIGAHAQHGEIRGRVLGPDGLSVPGANVIAEHNGNVVGAVTDIDGRFVLKPMPAGRHSVRISNVSFAPVEVADIAVTADRATYLHDVRMRFHTLSDTAVVIIGYRRKLIDIDDPARMSLLHEEIARDPNKRDPIALVSNNFAGVTAAMDGSGLHFRGSRTENMVSFIDGIKVTGSVPRIPPSAIGSISVYTGGLPAKYGDVTGGVVVIETRTYQEMVQAARARHDDPDL
jgi:hypothetical protein